MNAGVRWPGSVATLLRALPASRAPLPLLMHKTSTLVAVTAILGSLAAQQNKVSGLDGRLTTISSLTSYGRRGPAHPGGEAGMAMLNTMCNPGTVEIPWYAAMQPDHPKFGFLIARVSDGRIVQISDWSYCKHAFVSTNSTSTCGGTCNRGTSGGSRMGLNCSDTYSQGNNSDRYYLGPPAELDPWLGTWNPVGSYFDRGDPDVGAPANADGNRSLTRTQANAFDAVKNRITVKETDMLVPGATYFYGIHLMHQGEAAQNRWDNLASRRFTPTWNGSQWSYATTGSMLHGTILQNWPGATVHQGGNGNEDGSFFVACVVTGPSQGVWHYEYAVHNFDNSRGGQSLRIPLCGSTTFSNAGFRDIDGNTLNDWTWSRVGNELVCQGPSTNPQNWNQIFNFWFDCSSPPVSGDVVIDQSRLGQGAPTVTVRSQIPAGVVRNVHLGDGCGTPRPTIAAIGDATIPNASFALQMTTTPLAGMFVFTSLGTANVPLGNGCAQYLDPTSMSTHGFVQAGITGLAVIPLAVPNNPALEGFELSWQAVQIETGGPVSGIFTLSNGLKVRVGNNLTCQ